MREGSKACAPFSIPFRLDFFLKEGEKNRRHMKKGRSRERPASKKRVYYVPSITVGIFTSLGILDC